MAGKGRRPSPGRGSRPAGSNTKKNGSSDLPREMGLLVVFLTVFLIIGLRLAYIQVVKAEEYGEAARLQRTANLDLPARRGTIYDRNGNVLATSVEARTVYANPRQIDDPYGTAQAIASVLGGDVETYRKELIKDRGFVYIARKIDPTLSEELMALDLVGVDSHRDTKRLYPYEKIAGQVIGATGTDGEGLSGLESYYDDILTGTDGELIVERGRRGIPIVGGVKHEIEAVDGKDIVVSIDIELQEAVQKLLTEETERLGAESGSVLITSPKTGEILVAASTPFLDPNDLSNAASESLKLRPISDAYEPGSTFKPLTALIGLTEGTTDVDKNYEVPVGIEVGDHTVTDAFKRTHAEDMTLRVILERSSNVGSVMLAKEIGADAFASNLEKMGVGRKTGVDFPGESQGLVLTRERYDGSTLGTMSFGQGLSMPPVQLARIIGGIANEGLALRPHFLLSVGGEPATISPGVRIASTADSQKVADMMHTTVTDGFAKSGSVEGYSVAGKTGTGQRANPDGPGYLRGSYLASFIGFAPAKDPEALVYVLVDGVPYTGSVIGPLFSQAMELSLGSLEVTPDMPVEEGDGDA